MYEWRPFRRTNILTICPKQSDSTAGLDYLGYQDRPARWHAGTVTSQTTVKTLLILGASGDLTGRLLLPGLARLVAKGLADGLKLVGAGSDPWTPEQWQERVGRRLCRGRQGGG